MITRADRWTLAGMVVLAGILCAVIGLVPSVPRPDWIDPGRTLPADLQIVTAVYINPDQAIVRHGVLYKGTTYEPKRNEYWYVYDPAADPEASKQCLGRPYRWADPVTANGLDDPEIPDLLREYLAGGGK